MAKKKGGKKGGNKGGGKEELDDGGGGRKRGGAADSEGGPDADAVVKEAEDKMKSSVTKCQDSLGTLVAGQVDPGVLDGVTVEVYGAASPLKQVALVTKQTPTRLMVDPFDKANLAAVEKGIFEANVGMTPSNDGKQIFLNAPPVSDERRKELAKQAKAFGEEGKVAIRNIRKNSVSQIKKMEKALGKDLARDKENEVTKAVKKYEGEIGNLVEKREKELLKPR